MTEARRKEYKRNGHFDTCIVTVLTVEECNLILKDLKNKEFRPRHSKYQTNSCTINHPLIIEKIQDLIYPEFYRQCGFIQGDLYLLDIFAIKYNQTHNHLPRHTDGSLLSFNILLNCEESFVGGGTRFYPSGQVVMIKQGEALLHSSKVEHEGSMIYSGERIIIVGFIETKRFGSLSKEVMFKMNKNGSF